MLPDAVQRTRSKFITRLARNRHPTTFGRMLELTMAGAGRNQDPTAVGKQSKDLADLHGTDYEAGADEGSNSGLTLQVTGAPPMVASKEARAGASG